MKITFYDGHGKLSYNPNTEKNKGVGGAESIIIQTAKALSKRGHEVKVYIKCNFPDFYETVPYYQHYDYKPDGEDLLIGFENFPSVFNAKKVINWSTRAMTDGIINYPKADKVIVLSDWHRDYLASILPQEFIQKLVVVSPGLEELFFREDITRQPFNITYAGHPVKGGMEALIAVYERVKLKLPPVKIHVYGGGELWGWDNEQFRPLYDKLVRNGLLYHGMMGKEDMMTRYNQAEIFLYPAGSHYKEIFCFSIIEAMAAGCVVIASDNGNVKNLVGDRGFLIQGDIKNYMWAMEAVNTIMKLYNDSDLMQSLSAKSREFAKGFTWDKTAEAIEKLWLAN